MGVGDYGRRPVAKQPAGHIPRDKERALDMDMGVDQARDKICPVEIPLVEAPVRAADPDDDTGFYCKIAMLPCTGKSVEYLRVPVHHICRLCAACCRDQFHRGVFHSHTVISRMTAVSRSPLEVTYTYILYLPGSRCSGIATVVSVPVSVTVVPVVSNSCCSNSSSS